MASKSANGGPWPWFRLYTEARNDAKLRTLTKPQHYVWFNLLCFAAEQRERGAITGYDDELLAIEVADGDTDLLRETVERLIKLRILTRDGEMLTFAHFLERQYDHESEMPESTRERKRQQRDRERESIVGHEMSRDVTRCHEMSQRVTHRVDADADAEGDADAESDHQPPASSSSDDERQQQQHAHAREGDVLADAEAAPETATLNEANEPSEAEATPTATAAKRQALTAFKRQFADAAGLAPGERGQALDAIIAAYRPRAPDAELIVEATNCRDYYASRKTKRTVDCRLFANWLARWADQRAERQRQQQQPREDTANGNERRPVAAMAASGQVRRNGRRPVDLPDPTRDGRWADRVRTLSNSD